MVTLNYVHDDGKRYSLTENIYLNEGSTLRLQNTVINTRNPQIQIRLRAITSTIKMVING